MTAFNCASYLSLVVQSQRDGLDLLRRGGSSHRRQGNLGLSTSLYTPCIVRFCSLEPNHFCLLPSGSRLHCGEGTFLRVELCQRSSYSLRITRFAVPFQSNPRENPLTGRGFHPVNEPPVRPRRDLRMHLAGLLRVLRCSEHGLPRAPVPFAFQRPARPAGQR